MLPSEKVFHLRARPIISDHFPIMCLGACERGMRNSVSGPRLTTGLKRDGRYAIRRGPASPFLEENEWNGEWFLLRFVTTLQRRILSISSLLFEQRFRLSKNDYVSRRCENFRHFTINPSQLIEDLVERKRTITVWYSIGVSVVVEHRAPIQRRSVPRNQFLFSFRFLGRDAVAKLENQFHLRKRETRRLWEARRTRRNNFLSLTHRPDSLTFANKHGQVQVKHRRAW